MMVSSSKGVEVVVCRLDHSGSQPLINSSSPLCSVGRLSVCFNDTVSESAESQALHLSPTSSSGLRRLLGRTDTCIYGRE